MGEFKCQNPFLNLARFDLDSFNLGFSTGDNFWGVVGDIAEEQPILRHQTRDICGRGELLLTNLWF